MLAPIHRTRLWLAALALVALLALLATLSGDWLYGDDPLGVVAASLGWHHESPPTGDVPLETFLPGQKRDVSPAQALAENLASPMERKNPPAPSFAPGWLSAGELGRADECMAAAIYYEAAGEPEAGQMAVAQVILNRLRHPRFPKSVCGVVYQGADRAAGQRGGCQFTFTCDGSLARKPDAAGLAHAWAIADLALHGATSPLAGQATHYHTIWIVPVWAHEMRKVAIVGHHVFYRPPGAYGGYPVLAGGDGPGAGGQITGATGPAAVVQGEAGLSAPASRAGRGLGDAVPPPARGIDAGRGVPLADGVSAMAAPAPAPSAGAADHRRSYFAPPRRREGALALPDTP